MSQKCANKACKAPISGCNGFVKAGDLNEFHLAKRAYEDIRMLCGKCALSMTWTNEDTLRPLTKKEKNAIYTK